MKITVMIPDFGDGKLKNCMCETVRQMNAALADIYKKFDELRSEINGKQ